MFLNISFSSSMWKRSTSSLLTIKLNITLLPVSEWYCENHNVYKVLQNRHK